MIVKIKNADSVERTWVGQTIAPGAYYTVQSVELLAWQSNDDLLTAIGAGTAVVNDGDSDIAGVNNQINFLKGNPPLGKSGVPLVESGHITGLPGTKAVSIVTPNLGNRTTWYQKSFKVTTETLADSGDGLTFSSANPWWINIHHKTLTYSQNQLPKRDGTYGKHSDWETSIFVDGVKAVSGYTIDYASGAVTFEQPKSGNLIAATYWTNHGVANPSEWLLVPTPGKKFIVSCVELQYSMNIPPSFDPIRFEVWAGGNLGIYSGNAAPAATVASGAEVSPLGIYPASTSVIAPFVQPNPGASVNVTVGSTAGMSVGMPLYIIGGGIYVVGSIVNATTVVLVNTGYSSFSDKIYDLGFGQFRADYRNVWDIINTSNNQQSCIIPKHSDMQFDLYVAPYNYTQASVLDSASGVMMRVCLLNDTQISDVELASATFYLQIY